MPAGKSADKLGSRMGVGESLEILCPVLFISSFFASAIKMQDGNELLKAHPAIMLCEVN